MNTDGRLRIDPLPGVGPRYEIGTIDGERLTVVIDREGNRHINLRSGRHVDDPGASAVITARQASLLALILTGTVQTAGAELIDAAAAERAGTPVRRPVPT